MKVVKTYLLRNDAEDAASYLMTKGIPSNVTGRHTITGDLNSVRVEGGIELEVQDKNFDKASELLNRRESGIVGSLPGLDFFSVPWKKKLK